MVKKEIKICLICGKVDVSQEHIDNCIDYSKIERDNNTWK